MNEKMSINEMMDALRQLRNMANATKIGLIATGKPNEAKVWEHGALAVGQAIALLDESQRFAGALEHLLDAYRGS